MARYSSSPDVRRGRRHYSSSPGVKQRKRQKVRDANKRARATPSSDTSSDSDPRGRKHKKPAEPKRRRHDSSASSSPDPAPEQRERRRQKVLSPDRDRRLKQKPKRRESSSPEMTQKRVRSVHRDSTPEFEDARRRASDEKLGRRKKQDVPRETKIKHRHESISPEMKRRRRASSESADSESDDQVVKKNSGRKTLNRSLENVRERRRLGNSPDKTRRRRESSSPEVIQRRRKDVSPDVTKRRHKDVSPDVEKRRRKDVSPDFSKRRQKDVSPDFSKRRQKDVSPDVEKRRIKERRRVDDSSSPEARRKARKESDSSPDARPRKVRNKPTPSPELGRRRSKITSRASISTSPKPKRREYVNSPSPPAKTSRHKNRQRKDSSSSSSDDEPAKIKEKMKIRREMRGSDRDLTGSRDVMRSSEKKKRSKVASESDDSDFYNQALAVIKGTERNRYSPVNLKTSSKSAQNRSRLDSGDSSPEREKAHRRTSDVIRHKRRNDSDSEDPEISGRKSGRNGEDKRKGRRERSTSREKQPASVDRSKPNRKGRPSPVTISRKHRDESSDEEERSPSPEKRRLNRAPKLSPDREKRRSNRPDVPSPERGKRRSSRIDLSSPELERKKRRSSRTDVPSPNPAQRRSSRPKVPSPNHDREKRRSSRPEIRSPERENRRPKVPGVENEDRRSHSLPKIPSPEREKRRSSKAKVPSPGPEKRRSSPDKQRPAQPDEAPENKRHVADNDEGKRNRHGDRLGGGGRDGDRRGSRRRDAFEERRRDSRRQRRDGKRNGDVGSKRSPDRKHARNIMDSTGEKKSEPRDDGLEEGEIQDDGPDQPADAPANQEPAGTSGTTNPPTEPANPPATRNKEKSLMTRTGGAYIPPAKLRMMQAQITDKSSVEFQRLAWEALKKSLNGLVNKVNVSNIGEIARELLSENIVRGRGLLTRSMIQAQQASPTFTHVYAALAAIVNSKFPSIGDLLIQRLLIQFKRGFKRNDKNIIIAATRFVGHLVNQEVVHEILALEILMLLLENPTEDSVEVAVNFLKEVGEKLSEVAGRGLSAIMDRMRSILHESSVDKRVQYMIEVMMAIQKDGFKDHKAVQPELDVVPEQARYTHMKSLEDPADAQAMLNVFKHDADYEANEEKYADLKKEMLASSSESESGSDSDSNSETDSDTDPDEVSKQVIVDQTETNLVALRRTIYLTIQSSLDFEECAHKMLKLEIKPGQEPEVCNMILDCCGQQRTYEKFYGLLAQRFCMLKREYMEPFHTIFKDQYQTIHRLETNKLRNVAKFFAHLLHTDAISWEVLECIKLNEEETTSSGRIFIKFLFQDLSEYMGLSKLNARLQDETLQPYFEGIMPRDNPKNTRFAINFFTTIGLGGLTDTLRDHLKNMSKQIAEQKQREAAMNQGSSSSSSSSDSDSSSSSSSSSDDDRRRRRKKRDDDKSRNNGRKRER